MPEQPVLYGFESLFYLSYAGYGFLPCEEKYVTFAATGKGINNTEINEMNIRDLAAVILYAAGIELPLFNEKGWTAQIPAGLFADYSGEYRDISHLTGAPPRISREHHKSELI